MNFIRFKWLYFLISATILVPGIISLILWGLKPAVDFTGGTLLELKFENNDQFSPEPDVDDVGSGQAISNFQTEEIEEATGAAEASPSGSFEEASIDKVEEIIEGLEVSLTSIQETQEKTFLLRMAPMEKDKVEEIKKRLGEKFGQVEEVRLETVGPTLGKELLVKTLTAVLIAAGFILFYVARSFGDKKFGVCAILAMFHDTLILLGVFSLLGHFKGVEVDTLFVTAVLTVLSLSVHDTVVVFGRIREGLKRYPKTAINDLANKAITETLGRSINNSMTIIFMLLALWLLGGETTRWFVLALLIGAVSGTYSSTFVAVPLYVVWRNWEEKS